MDFCIGVVGKGDVGAIVLPITFIGTGILMILGIPTEMNALHIGEGHILPSHINGNGLGLAAARILNDAVDINVCRTTVGINGFFRKYRNRQGCNQHDCKEKRT